MNTIHISCRCGAIGVELAGDPLTSFYCHCDDCQAAHSAACVPVVAYRAEAVRVVRGEPVDWKVKATARTTCPACGTRIFASPPSAGFRGVSALLLPPGIFQPKFHIFCDFALLPVKDALPHYRTVPAFFGGSDAVVDW
jgi:hypothetical protein